MNKIYLTAIFSGICWILIFGFITSVSAQTTEFSYQGFLNDNSASANGNFDFEFRLFENINGGTALATVPRAAVTVTNGVFSVVLDFGAFPAANRYLEIGVRPAGSGSLTTLTPRSKILSTPFSTNAVNATNAANAQTALNATNSTNATTANNSLQLGGIAANQFVQTNDSRLSDARNPLPNNTNYIQNTGAQQTASNFNISGNGTAGGTLTGNIISATTQFNIGIARVLSSPGSFNFFAGNAAGQLNSTGSGNSLFGFNAGVFNTAGSNNAFFGFEAGRNNQTGNNNSFFGKDSGRSNTTGNDNAFLGTDAGNENTTGSSNSFFGKGAGQNNETASGNSYFGYFAGNANTTGANNAFFGFEAGKLTDAAFNNSFFGFEAGENNVIGLNNAFFGFNAGKLTTGSRNSFFGSGAGQATIQAFHNAFFGGLAGGANTTGDDNAFFGIDSGDTNTTGTGNTLLGASTDVSSGNLTNAAAIGYKAFVEQSNALVLGSINGVNGATANTDVGIGITTPARRLDVNGNIRIGLVSGNVGCVEDRDGTVIAGTCSSDLRFKKNITSFGNVLNNFSKLRPVNYFWRADEFTDQKFGNKQSFGLIAQEVEVLFPELVSTDEKGYKAINYSKLPLLTIQAVKELKAENDVLRQQVEKQNKQFATLQQQLLQQNMEIVQLKKFVYRQQNRKFRSKGGNRK